MIFQEIKTPEELMSFLDQNIKYGVIDYNGIPYYDSNSEKFQEVCNTQWTLRSVSEILNDKVGHCYDQVEIEREWFTKNGYEVKTFWISAYQENIPNSGFCHTYLVFKDKDGWSLFEHANFSNKGIHKFKTLSEAVNWQANQQIKFAVNHIKPVNKYSTCIKCYQKPPINISMQEYLNFINNSMDYPM